MGEAARPAAGRGTDPAALHGWGLRDGMMERKTGGELPRKEG